MTSFNDILGMNARNLDYIRRYNKKGAKRRVDDKVQTKKTLKHAGISVADTYKVIRTIPDLNEFSWSDLPDSFVVKPNNGFGGDGIIVIKSHAGLGFVTANEQHLSEHDLFVHARNILDGEFSLSKLPDEVLIEQRLVAHQSFKNIIFKGLFDVRVIVFNKVPVMAMLRLPTKLSKGKANLATGGVGVGIDMETGVTTHALVKKPRRAYITVHPDTKAELRGFEVPYWNEILEMAMRCQEATKLGFFGADITIDKDRGPLILEVNARPGLEIQNINRAPLKIRLERVANLKVDSIKKSIRLAKDLFGGDIERSIEEASGKQVIGINEQIELIGINGQRTKVIAKIDTGAGLTAVDQGLAEKLGLKNTGAEARIHSASGTTVRKLVNIEFVIEGQKVKSKAAMTDRSHLRYPIIIGLKDLRDFYIDPTKKDKVRIDYKKVDKEFSKVCAALPHIISSLHPKNLSEERQKFMNDHNYNPQFTYYQYPDLELDEFSKKIGRVQTDRSTLGKLFTDERSWLLARLELLRVRGKAKSFTRVSKEMYGQPSKQLVKDAKSYVHRYQDKFLATNDNNGINAEKAAQAIRHSLVQYGIDYQVIVSASTLARVAVNSRTRHVIVRANAFWDTELHLKETIAHEIDTHVVRAENGLQQPYAVFGRGLANYQQTEEGLAAFNELIINKNSTKLFLNALRVLAVDLALRDSFASVYAFIYEHTQDQDLAWTTTVRVKRGIANTAKPGACTKDAIYLQGYHDVLAYRKAGGNLKDLYLGKLSLTHTKAVLLIKELKKPKHIPSYY